MDKEKKQIDEYRRLIQEKFADSPYYNTFEGISELADARFENFKYFIPMSKYFRFYKYFFRFDDGDWMKKKKIYCARVYPVTDAFGILWFIVKETSAGDNPFYMTRADTTERINLRKAYKVFSNQTTSLVLSKITYSIATEKSDGQLHKEYKQKYFQGTFPYSLPHVEVLANHPITRKTFNKTSSWVFNSFQELDNLVIDAMATKPVKLIAKYNHKFDFDVQLLIERMSSERKAKYILSCLKYQYA